MDSEGSNTRTLTRGSFVGAALIYRILLKMFSSAITPDLYPEKIK